MPARLMRITLTLIAIILTVFVFGQDSTRFSLTLKCHQSNSKTLPLLLDTVYLNLTPQQTIKIYTNIHSSDSTFIIPDISVGKYRLKFFTNDYCISPISIIICSKCENNFVISASPKKPGGICNNYTLVEVSPGYTGGWKALSKEFRKNLTKNERNLIKSSADFKVHFYVTRQREICDISFSQDITRELKNILNKGLTEALHWQPAIQNGEIVDGELSLDKRDFLLN